MDEHDPDLVAIGVRLIGPSQAWSRAAGFVVTSETRTSWIADEAADDGRIIFKDRSIRIAKDTMRKRGTDRGVNAPLFMTSKRHAIESEIANLRNDIRGALHLNHSIGALRAAAAALGLVGVPSAGA